MLRKAGKSHAILGIFRDITKLKNIESSLIKERDFFRAFMDNIPHPVFFKDLQGCYTRVNKIILEQFGIDTPSKVLGKTDFDFYKKKNAQKHFNAEQEIMKTGIAGVDQEEPEEWPNGETSWVITTRVPLRDSEGKIIGIFGLKKDISDQKRLENELITSREKYHDIFETAGDGIIYVDKRAGITDVNSAFLKITEIQREDIIGKQAVTLAKRFLSPRQLPRILAVIKDNLIGIRTRNIELELDGKILNITTNTSEDRKGVTAILRDITKEKEKENQIKESLRHNEILLNEIHHRVKNNMQVIISLINLQTDQIKDKSTLSQFMETQDRIRSMAIVHEKMYMSKNFSEIDFSKYAKSLVSELFQTYSAHSEQIDVDLDIADVYLDIDRAIPCGLIINELITNAIKHASSASFKGRKKIKIYFHPFDKNSFKLIVEDSGIGLPKNFDIKKIKTLGLELITLISEGQLKGKLKIGGKHGAKFQIRF